MKATILYFFISLFLFTSKLRAQCIPNHEFSDYCNTEIIRGGPTFSDVCVPGWIASHGSPQVKWQQFGDPLNPNNTPALKPYWNIAYMWADGDEGDCIGEGMLANYAFKKDHTYKVTIRYAAALEIPNNPSDGRFFLSVAQNIDRPSGSDWGYGNWIPPTDRQQYIATITDKNVGWTTSSTYTFVPDNDYNQFWIYPYTTLYNQYNLYVDWIQVCRDDCESVIYYKQGVLPSSEPKFGSIYVGSSYGGASTPTVSATANTNLIAAKEIIFNPEFSAVVTTGSFSAKIEPCSSNPVYTRPGEAEDTSTTGLPVEQREEQSRGAQQRGTVTTPMPTEKTDITYNEYVTIFPNPAQNKIKIDLRSKKEGRLKINIINNVGVLVQEINSSSIGNEVKHYEIDTKTFEKGIYFIQISNSDGKKSTHKIVITR